ncbi:MAG: thiamine pyrophosphate-dependent enzyme, partial [Pseudomonadota bacterium]
AGAPPHDWLALTGGSIGIGTPMAVGAAVACPDRKVLSMHGDGGAMYTLQALWTQARENLDVVNVIYSNRKYTILQIELGRVGVEKPGPKAIDMLDLSNPDINWVKLGEGMGVHSTLATTAEDFNKQFEYALQNPGPHLIEVTV